LSKSRAQRAGGLFDRPGRLLTGAAILVYFLWYAFTASTKPHELLVGLGAVALTVLFFANVLRTEKLNVTFQASDLALCWHLPADILKDCWVLTVVLAKDLLGTERAGSFYRDCGFVTSRRDPLLMGRTALAIAYTSMSPNMLIIGIDPEQSLMLFHQVQRDEVPDLTRKLGARP
jgi:multisubunit Na+/H+ antiporter MnhE subunit